MNHRDAEMADVVVVLAEQSGMTLQDAAAELKKLGLSISDLDENNSIAEGTIEIAGIKELEKLPFVKYVRKVFEYVADFPPGDPRNLDPDDECEDCVD